MLRRVLNFIALMPMFVVALTTSSAALAGPTLKSADLAVVGRNTDGGDQLALVALSTIPAGSVIFLTDEGWDDNGIVFTMGSASESVFSWTVGSSDIAAGAIISFTNVSPANTPLAEMALFKPSHGSLMHLLGPTHLKFSSGDQLFIYQTANDLYDGTIERLSESGAIEPGMIYGFNGDATGPNTHGWVNSPKAHIDASSQAPDHMEVLATSDGSGNANIANANGMLTQTLIQEQQSDGSFSSSIGEIDNYIYNGPTTVADKMSWLTRIHTVSNWIASNANSFDIADNPDGGHKGSIDSDFNFTPNNAAPDLTLATAPLLFSQGDSAIAIDAAAQLNDSDGDADWDGGSLSVQLLTNSELSDRLFINNNIVGAIHTNGLELRDGTTLIGSLSATDGSVSGGSTLTITFNSNATNVTVEQTARAIYYANESVAITALARTVSYNVTDKHGAASNAQRQISVSTLDDKPTLSATPLNPTLTEGGGSVVLFSGASASTIEDGQHFTSFSLSIDNVHNELDESLFIDGQKVVLTDGATSAPTPTHGLVFSTSRVANTAVVTFVGANLDVAQLNALINGISYANVSLNPNTTERNVTLSSLGDSGSDSGANTNLNDTLGITSRVTVVAVNNAPVALVDSYQVDEAALLNAVSVLGNDNDIDSVTLTAVKVSDPTHGALILNQDGTFSYQHDGSETTNDSFTYMASDGAANSNAVTVSITVTPVNDAPVGAADAFNVDEGTQLLGTSVLVNDSDAENDGLTATVEQAPASGALQLNADGTFSYQHDGSEAPSDTFSYSAFDGNDYSQVTIVTIAINAINDAPVAVADSFNLNEGAVLTSESVLVNDTDAENDNLTVTLGVAPLHGALSLNADGKFTYTHDGSETLSDTFSYTVFDGENTSNEVSVLLTITPQNDSPVAIADNYTVAEGATLSGRNVLANDSDNDDIKLMAVVKSQPAFGTLTLSNDGAILYIHDGSETLLDSFTYQASDGKDTSDSVVVSIVISPVNDVPEISGTPKTFVNVLSTYRFTPVSSDNDAGDSAVFSIINKPNWASFDDATGQLSGTPSEQDSGVTRGIIISIKDSANAMSSLASFDLTVLEKNVAPEALAAEIELDEDTPIQFSLSGRDKENGQLTFSIVTQPTKGRLTAVNQSTGLWRYTPNLNVNGSDSLSFVVNDGELDSLPATIDFVITPQNDLPVAVPDKFTLPYDASNRYVLDVLANDEDIDLDTLVIRRAWVDIGSVIIEDGKLVYISEGNGLSDVVVQYAIDDGADDSNEQLVSTHVELTIENVPVALLPEVNVPADVEVNATGLLTKVDLGVATALDRNGISLPVSLVEQRSLFTPGTHVIYWQAQDDEGNKSIVAQRVVVHPLISLSKDIVTTEGSKPEIGVYLNGDAPSYPLTIPFVVGGSADELDHNLSAGEIVITQGRQGVITFDVLKDELDEASEVLTIELASHLNRGANDQVDLTITPDNIAPVIDFSVTQQDQQRLLIENSQHRVVISTKVIDENQQDQHQYQWQTELTDLDSDETSFSFDPSALSPSVVKISIIVTDDGAQPLTTRRDIYLDIVDELPVLGDADSDGDLIPDAQEGYGDADLDGLPDYLDRSPVCSVSPETTDDQQRFLVEGEAGVCIRKGEFKAKTSSHGLLLAAKELAIDQEVTNVGGIFDFIAYGLPTQGQSYRLVIPQRLPIPAQASYRKYSTENGWRDFVIDAQNQLSSAPGQLGVCPPPGSPQWSDGLTVGHWCVEVMIQDGGPNDDDGIANGAIVDPGGVGVRSTNNNAPIAMNDDYRIVTGSSLELDVLANDNDADGDTLRIVSAQVDFGTVVNEANKLHFTALDNFVGTALVDYIITDDNGGSSIAQASVSVVQNSAPVAVDDKASTTTLTAITIDVLANDSDPDNHQLKIVKARALQGGVRITENNQLYYTPNSTFVGTDTISYVISDGLSGQASAAVTISVTSDRDIEVKGRDGGTVGFMLGLLMLLANTLRIILRRNSGIS